MKHLIAVFAMIVVVTAAATAQAQKGSTGCGSDITNVSTRVELGAYNIVPDIDSPYTSGGTRSNSISEGFQINNCSFDFTMNLGSSSRSINVYLPNGGGAFKLPFFNFDRVADVPVTTSAGFLTSQFCTNGADPAPNGFVVRKNPDGTYWDNYGGCGSDANGSYVRRVVAMNLTDLSGNTNFRLFFQRSSIEGGVSPTLVAGTTYIKVYHPDASTWVLEPENVDNPSTLEIDSYSPGVLAEWVNKVGNVSRGVFNVPFRFTVTKL